MQRYGESEEHYIRRKEAEARAAEGTHCEADLPYLFSTRTERDNTMEPGVLYRDLEDNDS